MWRTVLFLVVVAAAPASGWAQSKAGPATPEGKPAGTAKSGGKASGKRTSTKLTGKAKVVADISTASTQIRRALVVQDTATLAELWGDEYSFTSLSGETYSKSERLESVMSPAFLVDEAAEVLPSELDIVRVYGNVAVVQSQLAPPGSAKSGSRGGRAKLLSVWVRGNDGKWRTVAAQATAMDVPLPPPAKKKK